MLTIQTRVGKDGTVVIPAEVWRAAGIDEDEPILIRVVDDQVRIYTPMRAIRRAQETARKYVKPGILASEELIAERRAEAAREECGL